MPSAPPRACPCGGSITNGRCDRCSKTKRTKHNRTTRERGYGYDWQKFRDTYLREHPLCMDCLAEGKVEPATEVHHRVKIRHDAELRLEPTNCMALCDDCHNVRSAKGE